MKFRSDLIQGTSEWLEWRRGGIGGSDIAAVLGISPWTTPHGLFLEKSGRKQGFYGNFATRKGSETEARARARYELRSMEDMPSACGEHPTYEFVRCSFDGVRSDGKKFVEIKCPGKDAHDMAKSGKMPEYYACQAQWQFICSGADGADYFSFYDKEDHDVVLQVEPDIARQGQLIVAASKFWDLVKSDTPPPLTDDDYKVTSDPHVKLVCEDLVKNQKLFSKKDLDEMKASIVELGGHPKIWCGPVRVSTVKRKGVFSYHKLKIGAVADYESK